MARLLFPCERVIDTRPPGIVGSFQHWTASGLGVVRFADGVKTIKADCVQSLSRRKPNPLTRARRNARRRARYYRASLMMEGLV